MAETKQKIYLKRSSVSGKTPTADQLQYGEPAINYHAGSERIFIKNSSGDVISFLPDHVIIENEKVTASALTDLNSRVEDLSAVTSTKVDKVSGKGLSTNDYTTTEKNKLAGITAGAEPNVITAVTSVSASTSSKVVTVTKVQSATTSDQAASAAKLTTAREITITDGTHTGTATSFNGTANVSIKLPTTITATIVGKADSATTADNAINAANATTATKIGTSSVGSGVKPIYINAGTPTASTSSVGGATQPVYLNNGVLTACDSYSDNDTKNTAGASQSTSKLFIVGATGQTDGIQTYSNSSCYISGNKLYSNSKEVLTEHQSLADYVKKSEIISSADTSNSATTSTSAVTSQSANTATKVGKAISFTNSANTAVSFDGSSAVDLKGGVYFATTSNSANTVQMNATTTNSAYPVAVSTGTASGKRAPAFATAVTINPSTGVIAAKSISENGTSLSSKYQAKGDYALASALDNYQKKLTASTGIAISEDNVISTTLDTNPFIILTGSTLPTTNIQDTKIYLLPASTTGTDNTYIEYAHVNNKWEKIGEFKPDVDLSSYATTDYVNDELAKKQDSSAFIVTAVTLNTGSTAVPTISNNTLTLNVKNGTEGFRGSQGDKGSQGLQGDKGYRGVQGDKGAQGNQGSAGTTGDKGSQGLQGDKGYRGVQGDKGAQGATGPIGTDGNAISLTNAATNEKVYLTGTLQTGSTMSSATWRNASTLIFSGNTLFINNKAALTEHQSLADYAKTADVPSIKVNNATNADTASKVANALSLTNSAGTVVTYNGSAAVSLDSIRYATNAANADTAYKLQMSPNTDNYSYPVLVMPVSTSLTYTQYQPAEYVAKILINPSKGALSATTFVENGTSLASKYASASHTHSISDISGAITLPNALSLTNSAGTVVTYDGSAAVSLDSIRYAANANYASESYSTSEISIGSLTGNSDYPILIQDSTATTTSTNIAYDRKVKYSPKVKLNPYYGTVSATTFVENGTSLASKYSQTGHTHSVSDIEGLSSTDTKNTAGASQSTSKLFIVGATGQTDGIQTYSNSSCYISGNKLYSNGNQVVDVTMRINSAYTAYSAVTATNATNATNATTATKLGSATVGSHSTPIFLSNGTPTACTGITSGDGGISGINTSQSSAKRYLVGASTQSTSTTSTNTNANVYTSGSAVYATNGFYETSDERRKDFEEDIDCDLDALTKIPKKYFKWKGEADGCRHIGTSAQELMKLYPEIVSTDDEGYLHLAYDKLSIIALAAIDKIVQENKTLKSEVDSLRKENQDILKRLKALEAKLS